jgi:hypothetical protein
VFRPSDERLYFENTTGAAELHSQPRRPICDVGWSPSVSVCLGNIAMRMAASSGRIEHDSSSATAGQPMAQQALPRPEWLRKADDPRNISAILALVLS